MGAIVIPEAGVYTINVRMREDGLNIDKLILAHDPLYVPVGMGQATTLNPDLLTPEPRTNLPPNSDAGIDATVMLGEYLELIGTADDDGLPDATLFTHWHQVSGPAVAVFDNTGDTGTTVSFSATGEYVLALSAIDGELESSSTVAVRVLDPQQPELADNPSGSGDTDNSSSSGSTGNTSNSVSASTAWVLQSTANGSRAAQRHEAGAVAFNGKLYLLGGRGNRPVSVYDPAARTWTNRAAPPLEIHHFQPVAWGDKIYAIGAMTCCYPEETTVSHIYTYTPASNRWDRGAAIPANRRRGSAGAAVHNGKIYLVGGNTRGHSGGMVSWFDEYDPATGRWRQLPAAPNTRDHMHVAIANGKLVVAGGRRSAFPRVFQDTVASVDVYDFALGRWTQSGVIPTQRAGTMAVAVGDEVIVIGGEAVGSSQARNVVEAFNVNNGRWRTLQPLRQGRHSGGAAVLANAIHVVSGNTTLGGGNETSSHETLPTR